MVFRPARLYVPAFVLVAACGGPPPVGLPPAPSSLSSSSPPGATAEAAACYASLTAVRPAGWVEVGKLVITVKDGMPVGFELRDASGAKVDAGDVSLQSPRAAGDYVAQKVCRIGGVMAVYDGQPVDGRPMVAIVVKPANEDPASDLADLCKEPIWKGGGGLDEAQKRRVAMATYEERLTSSRWRGWLFDMETKVRKTNDPAARAAAMSASADVLAQAAVSAGIKDCWYAGALQKR